MNGTGNVQDISAEAVPPSPWQPIETAPMNGTAVWLLLDGHPYIGYGEPANWLCERDRWFVKSTFVRRGSSKDRRATPTADDIYCCHGIDVEPTRWMPLPELPK